MRPHIGLGLLAMLFLAYLLGTAFPGFGHKVTGMVGLQG